MLDIQQGDAHLFQTDNDGDISVTDGIVEMVGGLQNLAYLCLFGGNEDDDGSQDSQRGYWGNLLETDIDFKLISKTQFLLRSIPAISANLLRIEDAANSDLAVFLNKNIASSVEVAVSIPALNRIKIVVNIEAQGVESQFEFTENWKADA